MTKAGIIAELRKATPAHADYGEIDQLRIDHHNNLVLSRLIDVILEPDYDRFVQDLASNVQLGLEQW